jgi:type III secretory pathway component EscV
MIGKYCTILKCHIKDVNSITIEKEKDTMNLTNQVHTHRAKSIMFHLSTNKNLLPVLVRSWELGILT